MEMDEAGGGSYYTILGVNSDSSDEEIRRAYRKLAMKWHPDKWANSPTLLNEAKRKFQQIQEAYSVLSDRNKRTMYAAGLYSPYDDEEEVEGFADFLQEMASLMEDVGKEQQGNNYTMEDLQKLFHEMSQDFESSEWYSFPQEEQPTWNSCQWFHNGFHHDASETSNYTSRDSIYPKNSPIHFSTFEMYGPGHYCR
ncbi:hypothetical protein Leryth_007732 [Lithospermum erythrorhizon]|nr:hypothetical protein Leryth_007732 [Lithospermum erythrorhizon]